MFVFIWAIAWASGMSPSRPPPGPARIGEYRTSLILSPSWHFSLLPVPQLWIVIRLVETHFSKHLGNQRYDPHFKHIWPSYLNIYNNSTLAVPAGPCNWEDFHCKGVLFYFRASDVSRWTPPSLETKRVSYSLALAGYSLLLVRKKENNINKGRSLIGIKKLFCIT